jgi:hypothetical protein
VTRGGAGARRLGVLWVGLLGYTVLYVPLFLGLRHRPMFPLLREHLSWLLTAWLAYLAVVVGLGLVAWLTSGRRPSGAETDFGPLVPSRWARRTGIPGTDWLGVVIAGVAAVLGFRSALWFPWLAVATVVFAVTAVLLPPEPWPVHPRRDIPEPPLPPTLDPSEDAVARSWSWPCRCRALDTGVSLRVRTAAVRARDAANPSRGGIPVADWENVVRHLVEEGSKDREPAEAARQLLAFARANRFNYFEEAQNTLQFAQVIRYTTDQQSKGTEYFRYAIETFYDDTGDCDCKAILAASLFRLMGLRSVVLLSADEEHAAVAVEGAPDFPGNRYFEWQGGRFYFCETTDGSFGFTVGEVPPAVDLNTYSVRVGVEPRLLGA